MASFNELISGLSKIDKYDEELQKVAMEILGRSKTPFVGMGNEFYNILGKSAKKAITDVPKEIVDTHNVNSIYKIRNPNVDLTRIYKPNTRWNTVLNKFADRMERSDIDPQAVRTFTAMDPYIVPGDYILGGRRIMATPIEAPIQTKFKDMTNAAAKTLSPQEQKVFFETLKTLVGMRGQDKLEPDDIYAAYTHAKSFGF